jgi:hypothetical protein
MHSEQTQEGKLMDDRRDCRLSVFNPYKMEMVLEDIKLYFTKLKTHVLHIHHTNNVVLH